MNPLYIALPLFGIFVWVLAVVVVHHDQKVRLRQQRVEHSPWPYWVSRLSNRWR